MQSPIEDTSVSSLCVLCVLNSELSGEPRQSLISIYICSNNLDVCTALLSPVRSTTGSTSVLINSSSLYTATFVHTLKDN